MSTLTRGPGSGPQNPLLMSPDTTSIWLWSKVPPPTAAHLHEETESTSFEEIPEPVDKKARTCSLGPHREGSRHMTTQDVEELKAKSKKSWAEYHQVPRGPP